MTLRAVTNLGLFVVATCAFSFVSPDHAMGQFFGRGAVGGVKVDADGVIRDVIREDLARDLQELRNRVARPDGDAAKPAEIRMISLKRLQAAMAETLASGKELPAEMLYLAGLQRVQYVFLYPDSQDIVIAGPAEPWTVRDADAAVVGEKSGHAPVQLEDLIVAFRAIENADRQGISCSIEPTAEGQRRLNTLLSRLPRGVQPNQIEASMREALGPQSILLTGVAASTHYAHVMVAADYQMKRLAMNLEPSPVRALPSYLEMAKNQSRASNVNPRWWMACDYDSINRTPDRMAWELNGRGVKTMTDNDFVNADGTRQATGKSEPKAQQWADLMTKHFNELAQHQPVFSELRNVMDLTVVAALIASEGLEQQSNCNLDLLYGRSGDVQPARYSMPAAVPTQCSFIRGSQGWVATASGGVAIDVTTALSRQQEQASLRAKPVAAPRDSNQWWWNG